MREGQRKRQQMCAKRSSQASYQDAGHRNTATSCHSKHNENTERENVDN